jgi:anti-anti-sigma regulatory factor
MNMNQLGLPAMLQGDWSGCAIAQQYIFLTEISGKCKNGMGEIIIDCSGINDIDRAGFQVLYLWLQCLYSRGIQPKIVKMSAKARDLHLSLGLTQMFEYSSFT